MTVSDLREFSVLDAGFSEQNLVITEQKLLAQKKLEIIFAARFTKVKGPLAAEAFAKKARSSKG